MLFSVLSFCLFYYIVRCFIVLSRIVLKEWIDSYNDHRQSWHMEEKQKVMRVFAQECRRRTHAVSCGRTNVHDMMRNESDIRIQQASISKFLHAPCSAMRSTDDTRGKCNQKNTYIVLCAWDHAHDVMYQEPEQCLTINILFHDSTWLQTMVSNPSISCRTHEIMRINECVI